MSSTGRKCGEKRSRKMSFTLPPSSICSFAVTTGSSSLIWIAWEEGSSSLCSDSSSLSDSTAVGRFDPNAAMRSVSERNGASSDLLPGGQTKGKGARHQCDARSAPGRLAPGARPGRRSFLLQRNLPRYLWTKQIEQLAGAPLFRGARRDHLPMTTEAHTPTHSSSV